MSEKLAKNMAGTLASTEVLGHTLSSEHKAEFDDDQRSRSRQVWFVTDENGKVLLKDNKMKCIVYTKKNPGTKITRAGKLMLTDEQKLNKANSLAQAMLTGQVVFIDTSKDSLMEALIAENEAYQEIKNAFPVDFESTRAITSDSLNNFSSEMANQFPSYKIIILNDDELNSGSFEDLIDQLLDNVNLNELPVTDKLGELQPHSESLAYGKDITPKNFLGDEGS